MVKYIERAFWLIVAAITVTSIYGLACTAAAQSPGPSRQERALESIVQELHGMNRNLEENTRSNAELVRSNAGLRESMRELKRAIERQH